MPAPIELIPNELLQEIFLLSKNIKLPLASPRLGVSLSNNYVYLQVLNHALHHPFSRPVKRIELQSFLLSRKLFTFSFIAYFLESITGISLCPCWSDLQIRSTTGPPNPTCSKQTHVPITPSTLQTITSAFAPLKCPLPTTLITAPHTPTKLSLLTLLLRTTPMSIDWTSHPARQALATAKRTAIATANVPFVTLLAHSRRLGKPPTPALVRYAVREGGCVPGVVEVLVREGGEWGYKFGGDEGLWEWVREEERRVGGDGKKAAWLRGLLERVVREGRRVPRSRVGDMLGAKVEAERVSTESL
ncbi:hypothetical protein K402DRAFT_461523 [Aulographum hederae CBS 113979]|uniref:Uncharacterized protein n=1 Tax=Aulographum hederae CBS 113979 TaxID=1176131 RepID=A0A6G1H7C2_9PEZI|nr:hypothetical protein K402DRAFT_461523 [Aulographum hederae CBS 113979]